MLDDRKKQWLEFFMEIINFDYESASRHELAEIDLKLKIILAGQQYFGIDRVRVWGPQTVWDHIRKSMLLPTTSPQLLVKLVKDTFEEIMGRVTQLETLNRLGDPIYQIKTYPELTLSVTLTTIQSPEGPIIATQIQGNDENGEQGLRFHLLSLLDGVPLSVFKKCPECDKWFIHGSKRKRKFCSRACMVRSAARKKREKLKAKDPEAYERMLEEARQRARKSYERRVRQQNPKAKIASRPRKRKTL